MQFATNPLPGMNPWLEAYWGDLHTKLTGYACDALQPNLPGSLVARVEEYLTVAADQPTDDLPRRVAPDISITVSNFSVPDSTETATATLQSPITEAVMVRRFNEPQTRRRIRILDTSSGNRVITAIEFLSPANKGSDEGRRRYRQKQKEFYEADVNLVEIDLIRGGDWMLAADRLNVPRRLRDPYRICVTRATDDEDAEMYDVSFHFPLPVVAIPLRPEDDDVQLELQPLLDAAYINGRYGASIDYSVPPPPPALDDVQIRWIQEHLAKTQPT